MSDENKAEDTKPDTTGAFHASFNSSEHGADLVLRSKDGIKFRVHSQILRVASKVFDDMLSLNSKRSDDSESTTEADDPASDPVQLEESALVLTTLLDLIYPQHVLPPSATLTAQLIYDAGCAAKKYDIDPVVDSLQNCLYTREVMQPLSALQKFGVARRLGWGDVAQWASTDTLALDLGSRASQKALATLDTASVLEIQKLHRRRRLILTNALLYVCNEPRLATDEDELEYLITYSEISNAPAHSNTSACDAVVQLRDLAAWAKLKFAVMTEMEKSPLGSRFQVDDFFDNVEFAGLWSAKFSCTCWGQTMLDKARFRTAFRDVLAKLPTCVPEKSD